MLALGRCRSFYIGDGGRPFGGLLLLLPHYQHNSLVTHSAIMYVSIYTAVVGYYYDRCCASSLCCIYIRNMVVGYRGDGPPKHAAPV